MSMPIFGSDNPEHPAAIFVPCEPRGAAELRRVRCSSAPRSVPPLLTGREFARGRVGIDCPSVGRMEFGSDPKLEAQIGRVCLIFARVEQEAGHVVQAADGNWGLAGCRDYLAYSGTSGKLLDWLKDVGKAYPEVQGNVAKLCQDLRTLKRDRDEWAHSAAVIDAFLLMKEQGTKSMNFPTQSTLAKLLNSKKAGHTDPPTAADVEAFSARASDVGDFAQALAVKIARLIEDSGLRRVREPNL